MIDGHPEFHVEDPEASMLERGPGIFERLFAYD